MIRKSALSLLVYGGLVLLTGWGLTKSRPASCQPRTSNIWLLSPNYPTPHRLDRTEAVIRRMSEIGLKQPGVQDAVAFPGLSISGFSVAPNAASFFSA